MTTETSKISNVGATPNSTGVSEPPKRVMQPQDRMEIREGMRVADVQASGSEAQKLVAYAFEECSLNDDYTFNYHGTFDKKGAEAMNDYTFALDGNELRAYNKKTDCNVTVRCNDVNELRDAAFMVRQSENFKGGDITFDLITGTATYDSVSGDTAIVPDETLKTLNIVNSDLKCIHALSFTGNLNITNTKNVGMIWDSDTELRVDSDPNKRPTLNIDKDSKVEFKYYDD